MCTNDERKTYHSLNLYSLCSQLFNLLVIVSSLDYHLFVFTLHSFERLLISYTLIFCVLLCALQLLLSIGQLFVHTLSKDETRNV